MAENTTLPAAELETLIAAALAASNTSAANARSVARALTQAEIDGQKGHGLSPCAELCGAGQGRQGRRPCDAERAPDAARQPDDRCRQRLRVSGRRPRRRAPAAGGAGLRHCRCGFVRSHHFGVVGRHVERLAEAGLIALAFANTPKAMAPWGGRQPVFGTSPLAFAAPQRSGPPIVVDLALSQVARGKILTAAQKGEPIPAGWAVDEQGQPTTDAKAALKGALQPIGGSQGRSAGADGGGAGGGADRRQLRLRGKLVLRCRGWPLRASASC